MHCITLSRLGGGGGGGVEAESARADFKSYLLNQCRYDSENFVTFLKYLWALCVENLMKKLQHSREHLQH